MSSPYRIPEPPRHTEPELDVSPAVVVLTVAAIVAVVLMSHENPSRASSPHGFADAPLHFRTHAHGRR